MSDKKVKLERLQTTPYVVNYTDYSGKALHYKWNGARDGVRNIVEVEEEVYDWLKSFTRTLRNGSLVPVDEEVKEDLEIAIPSDERLKVYSLEEIKDMLKGSVKTLKAELETMEESNVREFVAVAKQIKLDSSSKKTALAKKLNIPVDMLFEEEE